MITLILAASTDGVIGIDNDLPWHIPEDLKFFKGQTKGCPIIMGKNTWDSLPLKPLPKRYNVILSHTLDLSETASVCVVRSVEEAVLKAQSHLDDDTKEKGIFIIGGAKVYDAFLPVADRILYTEVDTTVVSVNTPEAVVFKSVQSLLDEGFKLDTQASDEMYRISSTGEKYRHLTLIR